MKILVFFIALLVTIFFINDKFSKAVRVIAFNEGETNKSAVISFFMMIVVAMAWTLFFAII